MKTKACYLFAAAMVLWTAVHSNARVIQAASCQFADVSNAVAQASFGDVVQLPPGTNWWAETLNMRGISLNGAGTNLTILIDEENRSVSPVMINLYSAFGYLSEISNIQFRSGVTNVTENYQGAIETYGIPGSSWRIDHNIFNGLYAKNIATQGNPASVIDHNTFYERAICIEDNYWVTNDPYGDASWAYPPTYGLSSSNVLYIENNYFTNIAGFVASAGATDGDGGGRMVFRYNIVMNDCFNNHGTESGGRLRSHRSFEVYNNTFTCSPSAPDYPIFAACLIRGGSGVIFNNTMSGYNSLVAIRYFRYTCSYYGQWAPFAGANSLSLYDSNDPTLYLTGTSSAPSGSQYLQVSGVNWTPNQWVGYAILNINSTNAYNFSQVVSNTANTAYFLDSTPATAGISQCNPLTFNMGDTFQFRRVFAALDQPGRGSGDLLVDVGMTANGIVNTINSALGVAAWPRQALDGIYAWGNTLNGAAASVYSLYPGILVGRDIINSAKPNYTPYTYPHPLTFISVNSSYTNTAPTGTNIVSTGTNSVPTSTNNAATNSLVPPPGLHLIH